jgi:phosphoglycolate phosphatase-like HAD superfamily hydrolase
MKRIRLVLVEAGSRMLLAAPFAHHIDLSASWMIGDSDVDMQKGKDAGCWTAMTARILSNDESAAQRSDILGTSLLETVDKLLKWIYYPLIGRRIFCMAWHHKNLRPES